MVILNKYWHKPKGFWVAELLLSCDVLIYNYAKGNNRKGLVDFIYLRAYIYICKSVSKFP